MKFIQEYVIVSKNILYLLVLNVLLIIIILVTTPTLFTEALLVVQQNEQKQNQQYEHYYYEPNGIQSGPDYIGSSYVTSTQYYNNMIYITGITYGQYFESNAQRINEKVNEQGIEINKPFIPTGCFVSVISLPIPSSSNDEQQSLLLRSSSTLYKNNSRMKFIAHQRIHDNTKRHNHLTSYYKDDFCYSIHMMIGSKNLNNPDVIILGHSEEGKEENIDQQQQQMMILDDFYETRTKRIGMIIDLTYDANHTHSFVLHGGTMLSSKEYQYPIITTSFDDDNINNIVYVVFIETNQIQHHHHHRDDTSQQQHPHLNHLNGYSIGLGQYKLSNEMNHHVLLGSIKRIEPLWFIQYQWNKQQKKFTTTTIDPITRNINNNNNNVSWTITGAAAIRYNINNTTNNNETTTTIENDNNEKVLIIVGTETTNNTSDTTASNDGYILLLNPMNGAIINSTTIRHMMNNTQQHQHQQYTNNNNQLPNYWIYGMCSNNNRSSFASSSSRHIYIVGSSDIKMNTMMRNKYNVDNTELHSAFIMKINIDTLDIVWYRQLHAYIDMKHNDNNNNKTSIHAISCAVTSNDLSIWVSGIVTNNGIIIGSHLQKSYGNNDIYITRYSNDDGTIEVLHQIGTIYNDEIAIYGGGILIDQYNNAIISGNTYGNLYRKRTSSKIDNNGDVFIMTCSYITGTIKIPSHMMIHNNNNIDIIKSLYQTMIWKPIHRIWKFMQSIRYNNHNIMSRKMKVRQEKRIFTFVFIMTCCIGLCLCTTRSYRAKRYNKQRRSRHHHDHSQEQELDDSSEQQKTIKTIRNDDRFGQSSRRRK